MQVVPDVTEDFEEQLVAGRGDLLFRSNDAGCLLGPNEPGEPNNAETPTLYICVGRSGVFTKLSERPRGTELLAVAEHLERLDTRNNLSVLEVVDVVRHASVDCGLRLRAQIGPAYIVPDVPNPAPGVVEVDVDHREVLLPNFPFAARYLEALSPCMALLVNGKAVCTCRSVRRSTLALEAGVDTIAANRRQGLGTAAVGAWSHRVREMGIVPCYSAHWENRESISLAERLKMIHFAVDVSLY
jgi:hypothetical protein